MKKEPNYASFSVTDFICDEYFQDWILHPDEEKEAFWQSWIDKNPGKKEIIEQAGKVLQCLEFREHFPTKEQIRLALAKNMEMITVRQAHRPIESKWIWLRRWAAAAIFIGIVFLGLGAFNYWQRHAMITVSTVYAQIKTIHLPDSSLITLNAHSSVSYPRFWNKRHEREVWLKGEAFFEVKHLNKDVHHILPGEHFIVHTRNVNVEVLGTSFDVNTKGGVTKVMLKTGMVELKFVKEKRQSVMMEPGDLIAYNLPGNKLTKSTVNVDDYTAWTDRKLMLEGASVKEIAQYLEDFYGYKIQYKDTAIENKTMEGTLMLDSLPDVLFVMSTALDIKIEQNGDTLVFERER